MNKAPFAVSEAWFWLVVYPFLMVRSILGMVLFGWVRKLAGLGFKPGNDLVDQVYKDCIEKPAESGVRLPWVNTGESKTDVLDSSGRLYAYLAITKGWFGLAEKVTGSGGSAKREYRYYYHRKLAGNWFAEIWSIWKSGFWAAFLALPYVEMAAHVNRVHANWKGIPLGGHEGGLLLVAGILLVVFFLPRAILGRGIHVSVIRLVNGSWVGGYGCTQVINWCAGLAGISYIWLAFSAGLDFAATGAYVYEFIVKYVFALFTEFTWHVFWAFPLLIGIGLAWVIIPTIAIWHVSLRYIAVRWTLEQFNSVAVSDIQKKMYEGSSFQSDASIRAPQIALGSLIYFLVCVAFLLHPVVKSIFGIFW